MPCFRVGCKCEDLDIVETRTIVFNDGRKNRIRKVIQRCEKHPFALILDVVTEEDLIKESGW